MKEQKILTNQTIFDICIWKYGTLAEISRLVRDNSTNYDSQLMQGDTILIDTDIQIGNYNYKSFFERNRFIPVSGVDNVRVITNFVFKSGNNFIFKDSDNFIFKE